MLLGRASLQATAALHAAKVNTNSPTASLAKGVLGGARIRKISPGLRPRHVDDKELRLMATRDRDCEQHERILCLVD
jgi:hypothetical protein